MKITGSALAIIMALNSNILAKTVFVAPKGKATGDGATASSPTSRKWLSATSGRAIRVFSWKARIVNR